MGQLFGSNDEIRFDITRAMVAQSQTALKVASSSCTLGLEGKLCKIHFKRVFLATTEPAYNPDLYDRVDPDERKLTDAKALVGEVLL